MDDKKSYTTVGWGMGGYYAVKKVWYEEDQMWDNCLTGNCLPTYAKAVQDAQAWAKAEELECRV